MITGSSTEDLGSSFRDPSGSLFMQNGLLYRRINSVYKESYDLLKSSGLYERISGSGLMVSHEEVKPDLLGEDYAYKILKPDAIPFISYPYEWCFGQLKAAALLTLKIQKIALDYGMSLKDASAFNIQFKGSLPIFIDTLSFEIYREGQPWVAYRQFCQHFLVPLALMHYCDVHMNQLMKEFIDGIPLDFASKILPLHTWIKFSLLTHLHLHAHAQQAHLSYTRSTNKLSLSRPALLGILNSLENAVLTLNPRKPRTAWSDYYDNLPYSLVTKQHKQRVVEQYLRSAKPKIVWDIGANTGLFSRLASSMEILTISLDNDPVTIEKNYEDAVFASDNFILPLCVDIVNPTPAIGWANCERLSIQERGPADIVLALGLVHHLAIAGNVPLHRLADFFSKICKTLIIEFIPKSDPQVQALLLRRDNVHDYDIDGFVRAFQNKFLILHSTTLHGSGRIVFLMKKK